MLSGLPSATERFLLDIERLQKRQAKAEREITSGVKIHTPSDAPEVVGRLVESHAAIERVTQTQLNLGRVKVEVDTAEKALQQAALIMDKARGLAAQGASGHQNQSTRLAVAGELEAVLERLVAITSTSIEGRYLFSGDTDQAVPYQLDPNSPSGVGSYQGANSTRVVADASGGLFSVSETAADIFESANPDENVFLAVNSMRRALLAVDNPPNPPDPTIPALDVALANLQSAGIFLNRKLAAYGLVQNRVDEALDATAKIQLNLKTQIASIEEINLAESASALEQARTGLEAAFTARAQTPRRSLFDYLG